MRPPSKRFDLTGKEFGRLAVLSFSGLDENGFRIWLCRCSCDGNERDYRSDALRYKRAKSCGCLHKEICRSRKDSLTHGATMNGQETSEHRSWRHLLERCTNPNNKDWHHYGGRGIKVCERWKGSFENFLADMGPKPTLKHSIDRFPDNNGNYEPGNCRWATQTEQINNRRGNIPTLCFVPQPTYYSIH